MSTAHDTWAQAVTEAEKRFGDNFAAMAGWYRQQQLAALMDADDRDAEIAQLKAPKFSAVSCSQCGGQFGPGNSGFSHCRDHAGASSRLMSEAQDFMQERRADVAGFAREVHDELERMDMVIEEMKVEA